MAVSGGSYLQSEFSFLFFQDKYGIGGGGMDAPCHAAAASFGVSSSMDARTTSCVLPQGAAASGRSQKTSMVIGKCTLAALGLEITDPYMLHVTYD